MNRKQFGLLTLLAVVLIAAVFWLNRSGGGNGVAVNASFIPGLAKRVNEVDRVQILAAGEDLVADLKRTDRGWTVANLDGYAADWSVLRPLLADLAEARTVEPKTANPDLYHRIGVEDIAGEAAQGKLLRLSAGDSESWAVILGNPAQGRDGQYARLPDSAQSVLLNKGFRIAEDAIGWADREILNLDSAEVRQVTVAHANGGVVQIGKSGAGQTDFELLNLPAGRELLSNWSVNGVAGGLANLRLEGVAAAEDPDSDAEAPPPAVTAVFSTFDGRRITAALNRTDDDAWLSLEAAVAVEESVAPAADTGVDAAADAGVDVGVDAVAEDENSAAPNPQDWVDRLNQRVAGWVYRIPPYKYDAIAKSLEDLLKPQDDESRE